MHKKGPCQVSLSVSVKSVLGCLEINRLFKYSRLQYILTYYAESESVSIE